MEAGELGSAERSPEHGKKDMGTEKEVNMKGVPYYLPTFSKQVQVVCQRMN